MRESIVDAGSCFGFGKLLTYSIISKPTLHNVYRCKFETGLYALKRLKKRPDLSRWMNRFEEAFIVEEWLRDRYSFLPEPQKNKDGMPIVVVLSASEVDKEEWYLAHSWVEGHAPPPLLNRIDLAAKLCTVVKEVSSVPLSLLGDRQGMDDKIPDIQTLLVGLEEANVFAGSLCWKRNLLVQSASMLSEILQETDSSLETIVGHRDLSPSNVLISRTGGISVVDWENVGPSTLSAELGRIIVNWCIGPHGVSNQCIKLLIEAMADTPLIAEGIQPSWFSSWLKGHLMYLKYLTSCVHGDQTDEARCNVERELLTLIRFVLAVPILLEKADS